MARSDPFRAVPDDAPDLIQALDRVAREHPLDRKVVLASARGAGRELLRTLARMRGGWTGFVVETPRPFALQLAMVALAERKLRVLDEFEEEALVDEALDAAVAGGRAGAPYARLAGGPGFRKAVRGAVVGLRLAGVGPDGLRQARLDDRAKQGLLIDVLEGVARGLAEGSAVDIAGVLALATEALTAGEPLPCDQVVLLPGLSGRGASGRFVQALLDRGATVLPTDPVVGIDVPAGVLWKAGEIRSPLSFVSAPADVAASPPASERLDESHHDATAGLPLFEADGGVDAPVLAIFRAAGVHEELREVLRRVMAAGRRFDEVEILTPDPFVYGPALHSLAQRLGIGVTFAVGLPVARTRPGRAVAAYLRWIGDDFPSEVLRRLLENDDLRAPREHRSLNPRGLARRLRRLRIGWGRERYGQIIDAAVERLDQQGLTPHKDETPEALETRTARARAELAGLRALTRMLLRNAPAAIPERLDLKPRPLAPSELARGLGRFLRLVPTRSGSVDDTAKERLLRVLDRIEHTLTRPVSFGSALGVLQEHLEIRVPAPRAEGKAPWLSDGGSLHLSDLEHGGLSGRPLTFVVGMDAGRFPGGDLQDPLLLDRERRALSPELPTSLDRLREQQFRMAALLARLRGEVVLSYPAWDATEGRVLTPSPVLLQAFRLARGDADLGFDDLDAHLGTPASRLPRAGAPIDAEDVWLGALLAEDHLLEGVDIVRQAFPRLDRGVAVYEAWEGDEPGPHHGVVAPRPGLDPRRNPETLLSASRLETLGACPLRYFMKYVLRLDGPDDPEYRPDAWLEARHRGGLLHAVYERWLREARDGGHQPGEPAFIEVGERALAELAARMREEIPPPSDSVFQREMDELGRDLGSFVDYLAERPARWLHLERRFGDTRAGEPPVELTVGGGVVRLRGAADRVDEVDPDDPNGPLAIVDYKTGVLHKGWARSTGVYHGGRRLQHLLYTLALETLEGRPVETMEYHFPTRRGEGQVRRYERRDLDGGEALVARLLDLAAQGGFVPTEDDEDCRFCDFASVCRVEENRYGGRTSRSVDWARRHPGGQAEIDALRAVRESDAESN